MEATKRVLDLKPGDVIPPPRQERCWIWKDGVKRMMTVTGVAEGRADAGGAWFVISATFESPYLHAGEETRRITSMKFKVRATTNLKLQVSS